MSCGETLVIVIAPQQLAWRPRKAGAGRVRVVHTVPAAAVMQATASQDRTGVRLQVACGFERGASVALTLIIGDKADKLAFEAVLGEGARWEAVSDVQRVRYILVA